MHFRIRVDTDNDIARLYFNVVGQAEILYAVWQWSLDSFGENIVDRTLGAMDFFPPENASTSEYYIDNLSVTMQSNGEVLIFDPFEEYNVSGKIAQEAINAGHEWWTTWSNAPGGSEDGLVAYYSGNKRGHFTYGNDQVLLLGDEENGNYNLEFDILVPQGKNGYFNILHHFAGSNSTWAMQCYLHMTNDGSTSTQAPGHGTVHAGSNGTADIACVYDAWMHFRLNVDTDQDIARYYYTAPGASEILVCTWQWSLDSFGENVVGRTLAAMDFFPPENAATSEFYLDNFQFYAIHDVNSFTITATANPTNGGTVSGEGTYQQGHFCTVSATNNSGFTFTNWTENGNVVSTQANYTFTVNNDRNLVANFSNQPLVVGNDGPYCIGETIHLTANDVSGASYHWTGPNNYSSNMQNPIRFNCTMTMAGTYTCTITLNGQTNSASTEVVINPLPTANFSTNSPVYLGEATQFTSTSTGQNIINYQWDFGDGQSGTGQNISHIYAQSGNYQTTLTVQTSGGCSDQTTKTVIVNPLPTYNITATANPADGGTITGGGTYQQGQSCTVLASANDDFSFTNWTENDNVVSTNANYTFTVTDNRTLVANFQPQTYTITAIADPTNGGEVSGGGTYHAGSTCVLSAMPNDGFVFENWTCNDIVVSTSPSFDFEVNRDATYIAHFIQDASHCTITAIADPVEGGAVLGGNTYELGAICTLTAIAGVGYEFVNWTLNGSIVSTEPSFSFSVTSNAVYVAHFIRIVNHYTITASAEPASAGSVIGAGTFEEGESCTLIAMPNPTYSFVSWTENGIVISTDNPYSFTVERDRNFVAVFSQGLFYTITASAGTNGTISPEGDVFVEPGEDKTFAMIPNDGYSVSKVWVDGVDYGPLPSYTFRNVNGDHSIHVQFSGLGVNDTYDLGLRIYPNPANDYIIVEGADMNEIILYDLLGIQQQHEEVNNNHVRITTDNLVAGTYILKVVCKDGRSGHLRFVVAR
jgi:PKD repeat protein